MELEKQLIDICDAFEIRGADRAILFDIIQGPDKKTIKNFLDYTQAYYTYKQMYDNLGVEGSQRLKRIQYNMIKLSAILLLEAHGVKG